MGTRRVDRRDSMLATWLVWLCQSHIDSEDVKPASRADGKPCECWLAQSGSIRTVLRSTGDRDVRTSAPPAAHSTHRTRAPNVAALGTPAAVKGLRWLPTAARIFPPTLLSEVLASRPVPTSFGL